MLSAWKYLCEERPSMGEVLEKLNEISIVRLEDNHKYEVSLVGQNILFVRRNNIMKKQE